MVIKPVFFCFARSLVISVLLWDNASMIHNSSEPEIALYMLIEENFWVVLAMIQESLPNEGSLVEIMSWSSLNWLKAWSDRGLWKIILKSSCWACDRVMSVLISKECSSGNRVLKGMFIHLSDQSRMVSPLPALHFVCSLNVGNSFNIDFHQKETINLSPGSLSW